MTKMPKITVGEKNVNEVLCNYTRLIKGFGQRKVTVE